MNETIELDIKEIGKMLLKNLWLITLCAVIAGLLMLTCTMNFVKPTYKASVTMYVNNSSGVNGQYISSSDLAVAQRLVETYTNIIASNRVLDKVVEASEMDITSSRLRSMLAASAVGETEMFKIAVIAPDPEMARDLVNLIAEIAPDEISDIIPGSTAVVVDYAQIPTSRYGPNYVKNTVLGFLIGGVLVAALLVIQQVLDTRILKKEDLEKICGVPVLGLIPEIDEQPQAARKVRR